MADDRPGSSPANPRSRDARGATDGTPPGWLPLAAQPVPWRLIFAVITAIIATLAGIYLVRELARVIAWGVVAIFFAVVLTPAVDYLVRRWHMRRAIAAAAVYLLGLAMVAGLLYAFIHPIVDQAQEFADNLPQLVEDAREGRGTIGELVKRFNIEEYVNEHQDELRNQISNLGTPAIDVVRRVFATLVAALTILVLTFLILLHGPTLTAGALELVPEQHRERLRLVAVDSARAVSGYISGNLLISVIAGGASWIMLAVLGVPYAGVLALWVAFSDLIPLVGATLGAIPAIGIAFLHSVPAGVFTLIFFIAYQQFENHVLQVTIMSRTVNVNSLAVLVSVLAGVELFGLLGALLAIPGAGVLQVVLRDLWRMRRGRLITEPSTVLSEQPDADAT